MTPERFTAITSCYAGLRAIVLGDYCLDRYLEIDPAIPETSIETGLPVHHVTRVRAQAGGAGTVLNNLAALGIGTLLPIGFCGDDGEGYELRRALQAVPGLDLTGFQTTPERRTFTYCKPLLLGPAGPRELSRLDSRNWSPTPESVQSHLLQSLRELAPACDLLIVMEQVDVPETGAVTTAIRALLSEIARAHPRLPIIADSRLGLHGFAGLTLKMNLAEFHASLGQPVDRAAALAALVELSRLKGCPVFVTMAGEGMLGATPTGTVEHVSAHPLRGPIDVVGAGDSVTANLAASLAAGATLREAMELAMAAASLVVHQIGTTGTASVSQIGALIRHRTAFTAEPAG